MTQPPTETNRQKAAPEAIPQHPTAQEKRRSRRIVLIGLLVVFVAGSAGLLFFRSRNAQVMGPRPAGGGRGRFSMSGPLPVVVAAAQRSDIDVILNGLGTVTPLATITVTTQISGYLAEVKFTEGQMVDKGDVLAVIDPRPYEVALEQAQGQLLQAQAQYREAQSDLDRYATLSTQDSISKQQVDDQRALVDQYAGMIKSDQGAVDSAKLNLTYCHITAPVAGRVGLRLVDPGNYVTPTSTTGLVLLTQVKPITVIFTLPEDDIPEVLKRVRAGVTLRVDAYNRDNTVKLSTGTLLTVDNTVDPTTGTFKLRAIFANEHEELFPDQFVNASMLLDVDKGATVIPTSAVERGQQGSFVYVVGADNTVAAKNVTLGTSQGERVAVTKGIQAGDKVVVDGADRLKDGMEVVAQLQGAPAPAAKPTSRPERPGGEHRHWRTGGGGSN